jgi:hypothetical protein
MRAQVLEQKYIKVPPKQGITSHKIPNRRPFFRKFFLYAADKEERPAH